MGGGASAELAPKVKAATDDDLKAAISELSEENRAKIMQALKKKCLIVTTSAAKMGDIDTGVWSEECCGPYYVFKDAGHEVTVCSIAGGDIPVDKGSLADNFITENDKRMEREGSTFTAVSTSPWCPPSPHRYPSFRLPAQ
jgi:DNA-binding transcriptional ArsR family regulator